MRLIPVLFVALVLVPAAVSADQNSPCFQINPNDSPDAAETACSEFLSTDPGDIHLRSEAFANRGVARRELGRLDDSVADLEQAVALEETSGRLRMLAWTYRELNRSDKAETIYTRVLETDDHWQGWLSRCVVRQDQKKYEAAAPDCEAALSRDPDNLDALFFGARAYNFLGRGGHALPLAKKAVALAPEDPRHLAELVWAHHLSNDRKTAIALAEEGLTRFPDDSELRFFLSEVQ